MIKTKYIRRHYVEKAVKEFEITGKVLEIGSGARWKYFPGSISLNRDLSAQPQIIGDAESLPFPDNTFDGIVCLEVIEHTPSPNKFVDEVYRTLKSNGQLLLTVPFIFEIHDERDYQRYTLQGLNYLLRKFANVDIKPNGGKFSVILHFVRLGPVGRYLYLVLNNIGYFLDKLVGDENPVITLGYAVVARK